MAEDPDGPMDLESLTEAHQELEEQCEELEAIVRRHARTMAAYGLDFTDNDHIVIVDAELAETGFAEMLADLEEAEAHREEARRG
jgi:hypothetical protein